MYQLTKHVSANETSKYQLTKPSVSANETLFIS